MKIETQLSQSDQDLLAEAIDGFVPKRIFDIHGHLHAVQFSAEDGLADHLKKNLNLSDYRRSLELLLPGRTLDGALLFPFPFRKCDRDGLNAWMLSELRNHEGGSFSGLALASSTDGPGLFEPAMQEGICQGLKPYHYYSGRTDTLQAGVEEFVPEWMWELCDRHEGILMIHLVRDAGVSDLGNQEVLLRLGAKYPKCKLVLPHIARSFNFRTARGLKALAKLPNVYVDTSAITEPEGIRIALDLLGPERILFGTDYPISHLRGHCATAGATFHWFYGDENENSRLTLVGIDSLLSLRVACEQMGIQSSDIEKIFFDNAKSLLFRNVSTH